MSTVRQQIAESAAWVETPQRRALLSIEEVSQLLGVSPGWVRDHSTRRSPRLPVVRFGGRRAVLRFRPQDVDRFINSNLLSAEDDAQ
jgi:hypothetical protein